MRARSNEELLIAKTRSVDLRLSSSLPPRSTVQYDRVGHYGGTRSSAKLLGAVLVIVGFASGMGSACGLGPDADGAGGRLATARDGATHPRPPTSSSAIAEPTCLERCEGFAEHEIDPELRQYREALPRIILTSKIVPVLYLAPPALTSDPEALSIVAALAETRRPERVLRGLIRKHRTDRRLLREALLRQGYLFESRPAIAKALVAVLRLADLFDEPRIFLHRGGEIIELERDGNEYYDSAGVRAKLLLNDRLAVAPQHLENPLHLDLDQVRHVTGVLRVVPYRVGTDRAAVRLELPSGVSTHALIEHDSPRTAVSCVGIDAPQWEQARTGAKRFWRWIDLVRSTAELMVTERPAFDEPKDEVEGEQEDGHLRQEWLKAYLRGRWTFKLREEKYRVFDYRGNPTPPQVCVDFIFDTLERSSGTWFRKRGHRPGRNEGFLDFSTMEGLLRRQTPSMLEFAEQAESPFIRFDVPSAERIPFRRRSEFAAAVARYAGEIREGDILVIHGLREEDLARHYHTVLVLRTDPWTGVPMVVADNAGRPRIRSLASVMRSAPRRSVKHRIRLEYDWIDERWQRFEERQRQGPTLEGDQLSGPAENR